MPACGGFDPVSACRNLSEAVCSRSFECEPAGFQQLFGSVENCATTYSNQACTPERTVCPSGYSNNSGNWDRCIDDYRHAPCDDIANGIPPASCNTVCTR
jgi:hypothetical protein